MKPLGELESAVMGVVWAIDEPATIRQVLDGLAPRALAHTTVITIAERLRVKGMLTRERDGRSYRYTATMTTDEYAGRLMNQVLHSSSDRAGALLSFAGQLDAEAVAELREALARAEGAASREEPL
ncbi:BlaI/MecI/CopY family transcriptional regulator [Mumia sp. DW29H23]|uniref:BlaI/MecI/CopY family transcriptional regulator n=1 Tax=Mumia sp. DW29H23 TaxID=3421241 RepID=UPI003D694334